MCEIDFENQNDARFHQKINSCAFHPKYALSFEDSPTRASISTRFSVADLSWDGVPCNGYWKAVESWGT